MTRQDVTRRGPGDGFVEHNRQSVSKLRTINIVNVPRNNTRDKEGRAAGQQSQQVIRASLSFKKRTIKRRRGVDVIRNIQRLL